MLYAALILEAVEVVLKVLVVLYMTEVVNGVRCVLVAMLSTRRRQIKDVRLRHVL